MQPTTLYLTGETGARIRMEMFRHRLTERERDVCWHYIHGRTYQEIAGELGCSLQSVKRHLTTSKRKLGFDAEVLPATPVRLLRRLCGVALRSPLVAA